MKIVLFILVLIITICLPQSRLQFYSMLFLPLSLIFIFLTIPIKGVYKKIVISVIILLYLRSLIFLMSIFKTVFSIVRNYPVALRKDDEPVRKAVMNIMNTTFKFSHNYEKIPEHPTIFVANYVDDRTENIMCITIPSRLCIVMGDGFIHNIKLHKIVKHVYGTKPGNGQYEEVREALRKKVELGVSPFAYCSRPKRGRILGEVRSGMFRIAKDLGITVTPIYFDHIRHYGGIIPYQNYKIVVGDTFYVEDIDESVIRVRNFFQRTQKVLEKDKFNL